MIILNQILCSTNSQSLTSGFLLPNFVEEGVLALAMGSGKVKNYEKSGNLNYSFVIQKSF